MPGFTQEDVEQELVRRTDLLEIVFSEQSSANSKQFHSRQFLTCGAEQALARPHGSNA